ncbi:MAG: energy transducer TonB [Cyclobacteriaceae bacterium]
MKKLVALTFLLAFVFASYAGNGGIENPKATNYTQVLKDIKYPQVCREKGIEGKVIVMLNIDKYGKITNYEFKSSPCSDLREAVEVALPGLKFKPAIDEDGEAVAGKLTLPVNFKLTI